MISRVAECCFWMTRYLERMDATARLLEVNDAYVLDTRLDADDRWRPILIVTGEEPNFVDQHGDDAVDRGDAVLDHLVWSNDCPASICSSAYWCRENARTIRDTISLEMWNLFNGFWVWLSSAQGRKVFEQSRPDFFRRCQEAAQLFRGAAQDTLMHQEPFDFMLLGLLLERGGQTARILDVRYHMTEPQRGRARETAVMYARWSAILRSCSATESFLKQGRALNAQNVADFLLFESTFPRSVVHCLDRAENFLRRIRSGARAQHIGKASAESLGRLRDELNALRREQAELRTDLDVHATCTLVIDSLNEVAAAVQSDYFRPTLHPRDSEKGRPAQSQTQSQTRIQAETQTETTTQSQSQAQNRRARNDRSSSG